MSDFRGRGQAGNPESAIRKEDGKKNVILMICVQADHLGAVSGVHVPGVRGHRNENCNSSRVKT